MTDDELIERMAEAMDQAWNPERHPIMAAMFRDYAATALAVARPAIRTEVLDEAADFLHQTSQDIYRNQHVPLGSLADHIAIGIEQSSRSVRSLRLGVDESAPVGVKREHSPLSGSEGDSDGGR